MRSLRVLNVTDVSPTTSLVSKVETIAKCRRNVFHFPIFLNISEENYLMILCMKSNSE